MGTLASPIAPRPIMEEQSTPKLHPFFSAEKEPMATTSHVYHHNSPGRAGPSPKEPASIIHLEGPPVASRDGPSKSDRPKKRRKTDLGGNGAKDTRQPIHGEDAVSLHKQTLAQEAPSAQAETIASASPPIPTVTAGLPLLPTPSPLQSCARPETTSPIETSIKGPSTGSGGQKATKLIKFNPKTGTLGSPPRPKVSAGTASKNPAASQRTSLLVHIKYGRDDPVARARIGQQIGQILQQRRRVATKVIAKRPTKLKANTSKTPHPFFSKPCEAPPSNGTPSTPRAGDARAKPSRQVVFSSTPCSPKRSQLTSGSAPQFGIRSTGLRVPGATLPPWPPQGMVHVRGLECQLQGPPPPGHALPPRKSKGHSVGISEEESILASLTRSTDVATVAASVQRDVGSANDILPPPTELRLPVKHLESGSKVQRRMRSRLKTYIAPSHPSESSEDELVRPQTHPVISRLFNSLQTSLSAYDRSDCDNSCWAQKYAPLTTAEILQPGIEGTLLKEWLLSLKIDSVDTGVDSTVRGKSASEAKAGRGKKRKKRARLEGFIVDSDEEANELDEIPRGEDMWVSPGDQVSPRTVIRGGNVAAKARDGRLTNAVVISGPHGCGKTAAVYAIAKELDFEIFEINASSRRSGKDVLERIGDMTRNHLVHHNNDQPNGSDKTLDTDEDQTAEDVKSGKQGTMTSFFKPNHGGGAKASQKPKAISPNSSTSTSQAAKHQKQSLILLEEVDVLYEEDKQFWATITTLIAQSKRPFIMTCNDETLLPLQILNLHGIFRFSTPPVDLAVDAMLLIAATEGHVLERRPVEELYEARGRDLRASLMELNYWCQIGVGDRRGGMDWFYLRWPKGSDMDDDGEIVRVISESTYQSDMGCFENSGSSHVSPVQREEEFVCRSWEAWGVNCDDLLLSDLASKGGCTLAEYSDFVESMSAADVLSARTLGQRFEERIDPTLPEMTPKARDDYILGRVLIDAPLLTTYCSVALVASTAVKSLARGCLASPPLPVTEKEAVRNIRRSLGEARPIDRSDFSLAFDPVATEPLPSGHLDPSVFDRTMELIVLDVAPFVRSIVAADERLRRERLRLGTLLSEGEGGGMKRRKTRSAMSALEGSERRTTRRERYFSGDVNGYLVLRTGGSGWQEAVEAAMEAAAREQPQPAPVTGSEGDGGYVSEVLARDYLRSF